MNEKLEYSRFQIDNGRIEGDERISHRGAVE